MLYAESLITRLRKALYMFRPYLIPVLLIQDLCTCRKSRFTEIIFTLEENHILFTTNHHQKETIGAKEIIQIVLQHIQRIFPKH